MERCVVVREPRAVSGLDMFFDSEDTGSVVWRGNRAAALLR
jgi:hypothetical protein